MRTIPLLSSYSLLRFIDLSFLKFNKMRESMGLLPLFLYFFSTLPQQHAKRGKSLSGVLFCNWLSAIIVITKHRVIIFTLLLTISVILPVVCKHHQWCGLSGQLQHQYQTLGSLSIETEYPRISDLVLICCRVNSDESCYVRCGERRAITSSVADHFYKDATWKAILFQFLFLSIFSTCTVCVGISTLEYYPTCYMFAHVAMVPLCLFASQNKFGQNKPSPCQNYPWYFLFIHVIESPRTSPLFF